MILENGNIFVKSFCFQIERDAKISKLSPELYVQQKVEILIALRKLGESLTDTEESFLQSNATDSLKEFEKVNPDSSKFNITEMIDL